MDCFHYVFVDCFHYVFAFCLCVVGSVMSSILRAQIALHRFTPAVQGAASDEEDLTLLVTPAPNLEFPARALDFDSLPQFARAVSSLFAAAGRGFFDGLFDRCTGFAGALLNAAQQFLVLAFGELEIVIRELGPLLLQLAFGDVPVAFDFKFFHNTLLCFVFRFDSPPT
jgi:hypothetical protein